MPFHKLGTSASFFGLHLIFATMRKSRDIALHPLKTLEHKKVLTRRKKYEPQKYKHMTWMFDLVLAKKACLEACVVIPTNKPRALHFKKVVSQMVVSGQLHRESI